LQDLFSLSLTLVRVTTSVEEIVFITASLIRSKQKGVPIQKSHAG
jgi:hypothetical protein